MRQDGVKVGEELCYRCKMGNRPMVMVFARKADKNLADLVKELDKVVAKNQEEKKMGAFVSADRRPEGRRSQIRGRETRQGHRGGNIAVVVPKDQPNGPKDYKLDPKADVTVLIYKQGTVAANHAADGRAEREDHQEDHRRYEQDFELSVRRSEALPQPAEEVRRAFCCGRGEPQEATVRRRRGFAALNHGHPVS